MGQNDGVKKLRQLRKEIAQIKTVSRERELGVRGATHELVSTLPAGEEKKAAKKTAKSATAKTSAKKSIKKGPRSSAKTSAKKSAAGSAKKKEPANDGSNREAGARKPAQRESGQRRFDQDAEDHRGRGRDAQGSPQVQADCEKLNKKFYAHDEQNSARVGDVVRIRETRPLAS